MSGALILLGQAWERGGLVLVVLALHQDAWTLRLTAVWLLFANRSIEDHMHALC